MNSRLDVIPIEDALLLTCRSAIHSLLTMVVATGAVNEVSDNPMTATEIQAKRYRLLVVVEQCAKDLAWAKYMLTKEHNYGR